MEENYEIERKFLIEYPDVRALKENPFCKRVEIVQTYLTAPEGEERRVRRRGENGGFVYLKTTKKKVNGVKRVEIESEISADEYAALIKEADVQKRPVEKTRYCLTCGAHCFEIDVYPFWSDKAIMEVELADENEEIKFPEFIKIIKEVTGDEEYKNSSLAKIK